MFSVYILQLFLVKLLCVLCVQLCVSVNCIADVVGDLDQYADLWSHLYILEPAYASPFVRSLYMDEIIHEYIYMYINM